MILSFKNKDDEKNILSTIMVAAGCSRTMAKDLLKDAVSNQWGNQIDEVVHVIFANDAPIQSLTVSKKIFEVDDTPYLLHY